MVYFPTGNIQPDAEIEKIHGLLYALSDDGKKIAERGIREAIVNIALADDMDCPYSDEEAYIDGWRHALRTLASRVRAR